ncbi:MAG TPA: phenylalanine--tRNA ligase subunit beta [Candidatus Saccharimonadales bacterium]|nr:phenylalanine--tRNA ligase subunit beta [Candidatus Saccharimonadales bacterium]
MKISFVRLREMGKYYGAGDLAPQGLDTLVEKIGAQLGAIEEVEDTGARYKGVVIAKVVSCEKHPNADKLNICRIDDGKAVKDVERGEDGLVQVVCGAPNVREGLMVAWLPPGTTVPETAGKDPFVLEARDLRGEKSNGMLASARELALGDNHEGLLELDGDVKPGQDFAEVYGLKDDAMIDIENKMFTHRPDCFGFLGVAREAAGIEGLAFESPGWYAPAPEFPGIEGDELPLTVTNELPELVPRFTAITMSGVKVGPSPVWLQVELAKIGQKSINNIVDYTNWYMLLTGQPLHAYDYDKVKALGANGAALVVRNPRPGEKVKLLNGKEIEPRTEAIMIATDKQLIGVGGIMGGAETEVDKDTSNIILECANFDMYSIRRTSMAHGLFTDAATRFTKGQSPLQNLGVLSRIVKEIREYANGKVASEVVDNNQIDKTVLSRGSLFEPVKVTTNFVNTRLGSQFSADEVKQLLENVEFSVAVSGDELMVTAPFWRTDVELREDVVEEVGRLYGYDHLPFTLPKRDLAPAPKDPLLELKAAIRSELAKAGANEVLTYSFVHGNLLNKVGQDKTQAFQISNALSPDLQYYRLSLTPSLLEKVHPNIKAGYDQFALFELGKVYSATELDEAGLPKEFGRVALTVAASPKISKNTSDEIAYYQARLLALDLFSRPDTLRFVPVATVDTNGHELFSQMLAPFEPNRTAVLYAGERFVGVVGEYKQSVKRNLKLPAYCAGFELFLSALQNQVAAAYTALPRFPAVTQDITLKVPADMEYQTLCDFLWGQVEELRPRNTRVQISPRDIFQREDDEEHKQVTFRLEIASYERTLTDPEVNKVLDEAAAAAKEKFGAERV